MTYMDLAANLARAEAVRLVPDANAGLNRHLDAEFGEDAERRAKILEAAKASDIADMAADYLMTSTPEVSRKLFDWFIDELLSYDSATVIQACNSGNAWLVGRLHDAALKMARDNWEFRHGEKS